MPKLSHYVAQHVQCTHKINTGLDIIADAISNHSIIHIVASYMYRVHMQSI